MNLFKKTRPDSISVSLPKTRKARGYTITRMPLGAYLQALKEIQDFPKEAVEAVFPGMSLDAILATLKSCDTDMIGQMFVRLLTVLPERAIMLISALTGIEEAALLEDADIGLDGLAEIVTVWLEVNQIENFTRAARALTDSVKGMLAAKSGSKG